MSINAWKTSFIGINKPSKVLSGTATNFTPVALWPHANSSDDPYWSGGSNPQYYQWQVTFAVNERVHGSNLTRTPFSFNAQDIEVGDFVAGAQDGKVCQILSILEKTNSSITAVVEDRLRYNTFRDPTAFGLFNTPGPVIFFQINELGFPMLDPLPAEAAVDFFSNVMSRFQYMNPLTNYVLQKTNHGFQQGDAICIENGDFVLSDSDNVTKFIGTVVFAGPGPDQFVLRPANGIIDFIPGLPGSVGDLIYPTTDGSGDLTTDDTSRRPIFMKVADAIATFTVGSGIDPAGTDGDVIEINRTQVILAGTGSGSYGLDDAVALINADTATHKITADKVGAATEVLSDMTTLGSAYGVIAGYTPFSAEINGVLVNFTTTTSGSAAYGDPAVADLNDMVTDINAANVPNIIASVVNGSDIKLRNNIGGAITIVNISADSNGNNFAGPTSLSSIPLSTPANTTTYALRLQRTDGGPMTIRDVQGTFLDNAGVISGQNGRYALGLYIEQGLRSSNTTVVADLTARDALYPLVGDQAYVIDAGNGEWGTYLWNGSAWEIVGTQRAATADSGPLSATIDLGSISGTQLVQSLGFITAGKRVVEAKVVVNTACTSGSTVKLGTASNNQEYMDAFDSDLTAVAEYFVVTSIITSAYTEVFATVDIPAGATGNITVIVTYV